MINIKKSFRNNTFPKIISLTVNVIERHEFKLGYFEAAVQHVRVIRHGDSPINLQMTTIKK